MSTVLCCIELERSNGHMGFRHHNNDNNNHNFFHAHSSIECDFTGDRLTKEGVLGNALFGTKVWMGVNVKLT